MWKSKTQLPLDRLFDIFYSKVELAGDNDCWIWQGSVHPRHGYGMYSKVRAHRFSFFIHYGPIPDWAVVMHSCDRKNCANPNHLALGTQEDNLKDMARKGRARNYDMTKTMCKYGHPFDEANTIPRGGKRRGRICRICRQRAHAQEDALKRQLRMAKALAP